MPRPVLPFCHSLAICLAVALQRPAHAQTDMKAVIDRLERLEQQNLELVQEIRALRSELKGARTAAAVASDEADVSITPPETPPLEERVSVQERRLEEQAQSKVESGLKLPVRLTGMILFNAYSNSRFSGTAEYPTTAALNAGQQSAGAYVRQSLVGLKFDGGETLGGGKLSGSLYMDFFAGSSFTLNHLFRIRTASAQVDWSRTTVKVGQEKPIFSPRDPTSFAQVGVSPMTGAGNPWFWQPQLVVEQRFALGEETLLRAQVGVLQTNEVAAIIPAAFTGTLERSRPALEGRFEFRHRKLEIAPGFHFSTSHVAGTSVPSNAVSIDWLFSPLSKMEFSGFVFAGANLANLGTLRQGFTILAPGEAIGIRSRGGWAQLALLPTARLSFHLMAGQQDDNNADLRYVGLSKNQNYAANIMYRLGPNLIIALEGSQVRTAYMPGGLRRNNHYDLAFAYLF